MRLRDWRKKAGMSVEAFALRCGVAVSTVYGYENGSRTPGAEIAQKIEIITKGAVSAASLIGLAPLRSANRGVREDAVSYASDGQVSVTVAVTEDQARMFARNGIDIEAVARAGAEKALKEAEAKAWAEANREAIEASKAWIEKYGTFAEQLGLI